MKSLMYSLARAVQEHFSDGKLNTLVKDKFGRNHFVLKEFVKHGAPEEILYEAKPLYWYRYFKRCGWHQFEKK